MLLHLQYAQRHTMLLLCTLSRSLECMDTGGKKGLLKSAGFVLPISLGAEEMMFLLFFWLLLFAELAISGPSEWLWCW